MTESAKKRSVWSEFERPFQVLSGMVVLMAIYVYRLPTKIKPEVVELPDPIVLKSNDDLRKAEFLFRAQVEGPECVVFSEDKSIISGLSDGRIVRVDMEFEQVDILTFTGDPNKALPFPCGEHSSEHLCGRPLGMDISSDGTIFIADAYMGILSMDLSKLRISVLTKATNDQHKIPMAHSNAIAVGPVSGNVYFTDSSVLHKRRDAYLVMLDVRPTGRLIKYNTERKKTSTLLHMTYPNGILCSKDESYLLVAETALARIMKYHLSGPKKGKVEVFIDNLPLWPDNLSWDNKKDRDLFWVGGVSRGSSSWLNWLMKYPNLRVLMSKVVTSSLFDWMMPKHGIVLLLDSSGKILAAPQDSTGRLSSISGAYSYGDSVYFGSHLKNNNYIAKVPRSSLTGVPQYENTDTGSK